MTHSHPKDLGLSNCSAVLSIELDPQTTPFDAIPPQPLNREAAADVAKHLAEDLKRNFEGIEQLSMVVPGALYDQTEVLRPDFPLLGALEDIFYGILRHGVYTPQLIALGTDRGHFPMAAIDPQRCPSSGPLLLIPFIFAGQEDSIAALSNDMENTLLQNGEVSPATREAVQQAFGLQAVNMSYATLSDLCALLQVQMQSQDFGGLWTLLEHVLLQRSGVQQVRSDNGNLYLVADGQVYAPFYTFDGWAQFGPGQNRDVEELVAGYGEWLRVHRQYTMTLEAYGVPTRLLLGNPELERQTDAKATLSAALTARELADDYLIETAMRASSDAPERRLLITNQFHEELGTLAYTVMALDQTGQMLSLEHHYPLRPQGLQTIIDSLIQRSDEYGAERQVLHPRTLIYSAEGRCLESAAEQPRFSPRHH